MYPVKVRTHERREGKDVRREEIQDKVKESVELRKYKRHGVSVLCPTGPELGSWQGSHYKHVSDSSLSHYTSRQLTRARF